MMKHDVLSPQATLLCSLHRLTISQTVTKVLQCFRTTTRLSS